MDRWGNNLYTTLWPINASWRNNWNTGKCALSENRILSITFSDFFDFSIFLQRGLFAIYIYPHILHMPCDVTFDTHNCDYYTHRTNHL